MNIKKSEKTITQKELIEPEKKHMAYRTNKEKHGLWNTQRNTWLIEHTKKHMAYRILKETHGL